MKTPISEIVSSTYSSKCAREPTLRTLAVQTQLASLQHAVSLRYSTHFRVGPELGFWHFEQQCRARHDREAYIDKPEDVNGWFDVHLGHRWCISATTSPECGVPEWHASTTSWQHWGNWELCTAAFCVDRRDACSYSLSILKYSEPAWNQ